MPPVKRSPSWTKRGQMVSRSSWQHLHSRPEHCRMPTWYQVRLLVHLVQCIGLPHPGTLQMLYYDFHHPWMFVILTGADGSCNWKHRGGIQFVGGWWQYWARCNKEGRWGKAMRRLVHIKLCPLELGSSALCGFGIPVSDRGLPLALSRNGRDLEPQIFPTLSMSSATEFGAFLISVWPTKPNISHRASGVTCQVSQQFCCLAVTGQWQNPEIYCLPIGPPSCRLRLV